MQCRLCVTVSCYVNLEGDCVGFKTTSVTVRVLLTVGLGVAVSSVEKACHTSHYSSVLISFIHSGSFLARGLSHWPPLIQPPPSLQRVG